MNAAGFTVDRPVLTAMVTLIVVTLGLMSLTRLPIDLLPDITYPTITVTTNYQNAGPEEVEQLVTRPVEEAVSAVPGVEEVSSTSTEGNSNVRVSFSWGTNLDEATNEIRDRLDRIANALPDDADRPQVRKFDTGSSPILLLGASSRLDPIEARQIIDDRIRPRLERVPGVAAVDVWGGLEREIRVEVDMDRLLAFGLGLDAIQQSIRDANVVVPAGEIQRGRFDIRLRTPAEFRSLDELRATVLDVRDGAPIYLHQVAEVRDTHQRITRLIRINEDAGVRLAIRKQSDANTVQVADAVKRELGSLNRDFPQFNLVPAIDNARFIERSIANVSRSILYGGSLAILVLLFFLRNIRSTLVAATAIPVSVIATFMLIYFGGFTLNLMTLGGLALGVGLMVDNAIVVIENISRHQQEYGSDSRKAAIIGTGEVSPAIIASTLTTMAIFLPMFFAQELGGVLFRQLAFVVAFALFCSLLVALTLVPTLMGLMRNQQKPATGAVRRLSDGCGRMVQGLENAQLRALNWTLSHRAIAISIAGLTFILAVALVPRLGTEFMPPTDEGELRVSIEMEPGTRLEVLDRRVRQVERILADAVPEASNIIVSVGASGFRASSPATASIQIQLADLAERGRSSEQIAAELRPALANLPGTTVRVRASQGMIMRGLGTEEGERLSVEIRGFELDVLDQLGREVERLLRDVDGITDVRMGREEGMPQQVLRIDRQRAADQGVNVAQVARAVETAMAGSSAGQFRDGGTEHRIWVQLRDAEQMGLDDILNLTLPGSNGEAVALRNLVRFEPSTGPIQIFRKEQQRLNTVSANIAGRDLGSVVAEAQQRLDELPLPRNVDITFAGDFEEQQAAFSELFINLLLAVALVYMVMASLYESFRDPLIVMCAVPLAAIGVISALLLTDTTLNVQSFIGCIMLVGIAVNNAILLVDQSARLHRKEGLAVREAVTEASRRRLRPILMTSLTTILALLPLALGWGEGGEAQAPMARAVIGGLLSSTIITLLIIPALYTLFHRDTAVQTQPQGATT
ncbi:MAG: efflux RND transporter permease subunit [Ectothiorhodospiraceae bacterium]|nr:efflux RND transporter permease subunit [Ectothiorhodospiraceae bacterium]